MPTDCGCSGPTHDASGLLSWNELGFDDVLIQSNYFETPSLPIARVIMAAGIASAYGMGIELESGQSILTSPVARARYHNQLVADYLAGAEGNVMHAFYGDSQILVDAAYSHDPSVWRVYMDTYDFLIGQFTYRSYLRTDGTQDD